MRASPSTIVCRDSSLRDTDVGSIVTRPLPYLGISNISVSSYSSIFPLLMCLTLCSLRILEMNNTKETLSSVRDVIPDIGGNFQLDPAVIESKELHLKPHKATNEAKLY